MKLQCDGPLSNFAFNFNLRHYFSGLLLARRFADVKRGGDSLSLGGVAVGAVRRACRLW